MKLSSGFIVNVGFGGAMLVLIVISAVSYLNVTQLREMLQRRKLSYDLKSSIDNILKNLLDAETGQRGYLLTGKESYLEPYNAAVMKIGPLVYELTHLTGGNPLQTQRVEQARPLIDGKLSELADTIKTFKAHGFAETIKVVETDRGQSEMQQLRAIFSAMNRDEDVGQKARTEQVDALVDRTTAVLVLCALAGLVTGAGSIVLFSRERAQRAVADRALIESEKNLHQLIDNVRDYGIYKLDPEGRVTSWNTGAQRLKGYSAAEIIGKHFGCFFTEEDIKAGKPAKLLETATQTGRAENEGWRRRKDGTLFWANAVITAITDSSGRVIGFSKVSQDMTERRAAEEALRKSEERLNLAVEAVQMGVWEYDFKTDRGERSLRHDQIMGYSTLQTEWGFEIFMKQVVPEDRESARRQFEAAPTTGHLNLECRVHWPDGSLHWIVAQGDVTYDDKGQPQRMRGVISEITERKHAEEAIVKLNQELKQKLDQLELANKELESFSYSVSHDLRAPLRHVDGFVDLLKGHANASMDAKGQRYLKIISDSAQQMGRLIDDLLSFSRMGRTELRRRRFELKALAEVCIQETALETANRTVEWKVGELPSVYGDPAMLRQVFVNLIGNAVKYTRTREKAVIEIGANGSGCDHVIYIRDNGVGFDPTYTNKLFGVFQRLHRSDEFEGTGIGLANVRRIITRHGGRTWAESTVDHGATFYFSLPKSGELQHERTEKHSVG